MFERRMAIPTRQKLSIYYLSFVRKELNKWLKSEHYAYIYGQLKQESILRDFHKMHTMGIEMYRSHVE